jgi:hypothetical protein
MNVLELPIHVPNELSMIENNDAKTPDHLGFGGDLPTRSTQLGMLATT